MPSVALPAKLEPSSGAATDPFIIASLRAVGEFTEGIDLITSHTSVKAVVGLSLRLSELY